MLTASCQILFLHYFCFCSLLSIKKVSTGHSPKPFYNLKKCPWTRFSRLLLISQVIACSCFFKSYFCTISVFFSFLIISKKVSMDPVHDRGCMNPVHESGPWTRSKVGVHGPLVHNRLKFDSRIFYSVVQ